MPSKEQLMSGYKSAKEIHDMAINELGVSSSLVNIKIVNGVKYLVACLSSNPEVTFEGSGVTNKEAMADCISKKFPS